jgi:nitroimidazol reductase NimA-like FMN-containing flavoprotein (pyridoxamine 5'-phosphate oxidase superfamily)
VHLTRVGRHPERGHYDFRTIAAILDEAVVCNVGFVNEDQPIVIPTTHARIERSLYIHGSSVAGWMNTVGTAIPICVCVNILDGLVLARSAYHHSLNYRSVVVFGRAVLVVDEREKVAALRAIVEHICPGRWDDVRQPNKNELKATKVLRMDVATASAKIRAGPPLDFERDLGSSFWSGVVPVTVSYGEPIADPNLQASIPVPRYLRR